MSQASLTRAPRVSISQATIWPLVTALAIVCAYIPTGKQLYDGPWQTEQQGHGPLIIAATLWLAWQSRDRLRDIQVSPAPLLGWSSLGAGLILMFLARTQGVLPVEAVSILPVLCGAVLILGGWSALKVLAFPIAFLIFAVPVPDWIIDAATIPLKVLISDLVTHILYAMGFPVAQNGVMIMIGAYQLLVKDACSGMNSIFALSAIAVFYVYVFRWDSKIRAAILLLSIIPITIFANFLRVLALVLIAYYGGVDRVEGLFHDATGIALFVIAVLLMFAVDGILSLISHLFQKRGTKPASA